MSGTAITVLPHFCTVYTSFSWYILGDYVMLLPHTRIISLFT